MQLPSRSAMKFGFTIPDLALTSVTWLVDQLKPGVFAMSTALTSPQFRHEEAQLIRDQCGLRRKSTMPALSKTQSVYCACYPSAQLLARVVLTGVRYSACYVTVITNVLCILLSCCSVVLFELCSQQSSSRVYLHDVSLIQFR
jgi:hypothetical protein